MMTTTIMFLIMSCLFQNTSSRAEYQELTEIAAQWKDKDKEQRLTVVERAMKCPSSQEEESKPAKTKKLALPHWERTPHAMQRPHGHQVLL